MNVIQSRCGFTAVRAAVVPGAQDVGSKSVACVLFANEQNAINARFHQGQPAGSILGKLVARLLLCCYTLNTGKGRPKPLPPSQAMNITFNDVKELATEYGFDLAQMRDDYINNRVTADELWSRLNEEISADMGY